MRPLALLFNVFLIHHTSFEAATGRIQAATGRIQEEAEEARADAMGPAVLDWYVPALQQLAGFGALRSAGRRWQRTLAAYFNYYHPCRPHLAIEKQCPIERQIMEQGTIVEIVELGGLHHRYERIAA